MKIGIANDHGGYELKFNLTKILEEKGYIIVNYGSDTSERVDYPEYAFKLCHAVINKEIDLGIVLCKTGIGVSIASNKVKGIRCGHCSTKEQAHLTKEHNHANVIALSYKQDINELAEMISEIIEEYKKKEEELKKLRAQIDQIKKEQLNFYALPLSILYAVDQYNVPAGEMGKMKAIARVMKDNPDYKFTIVGFADYTGSPEYNQKLSVKRAEEAKKVLVKKYGIAEDRLIVDGKGQGSSFGDVKLSINRRVSFYRVIE